MGNEESTSTSDAVGFGNMKYAAIACVVVISCPYDLSKTPNHTPERRQNRRIASVILLSLSLSPTDSAIHKHHTTASDQDTA